MTAAEVTLWLERLLSLPLPEPDDDLAWFLGNKPYLDAIASEDLGLGDELCELVHHYVADVDVRRRDDSYRKCQDAMLRKHLLQYRRKLEGHDRQGG